jgi:Domain of unknown function (DUF4398)
VWGILLLLFTAPGCTLMATRPVQEMANATAALRAAREVQSDSLAPELFRQSNELFLKAKKEYRFKNFYLAKEYLGQSQKLAERAEFEAIRNGGSRAEVKMDSPAATPPGEAPGNASGPGTPQASEPYPYPTPQPIPADVYSERMNQRGGGGNAGAKPSP